MQYKCCAPGIMLYHDDTAWVINIVRTDASLSNHTYMSAAKDRFCAACNHIM